MDTKALSQSERIRFWIENHIPHLLVAFIVFGLTAIYVVTSIRTGNWQNEHSLVFCALMGGLITILIMRFGR